MKNNKGFTIIELVVSFSLTIIVVIVLFQIIIVLKDLFEISSNKTTLLNKQSLIYEKIYKDINDNNIVAIEQCGNYCLEFFLNDSTSKIFEVSKEDLTIKYGDFVTKFPSTVLFGSIYFNNTITASSSSRNSVFKILVPIYDKTINDMTYDIDITMFYNYDVNKPNRIDIPTEFDLVDGINSICGEGSICKNIIYDIGSEITFAGKSWRVISNNDFNITLLSDNLLNNEETPISMQHTNLPSNHYKWSTSFIQTYLNDTFLSDINSAKTSSLNEIINIVGICDDETSEGGYPGSISSFNTCNSSYINSSVRLLDISEYTALKVYLTDNSLSTEWLYGNSIGSWLLSNGSGAANEISIVTTTGESISNEIETDTYSYIRPVITVTKK